MTEPVLVASVLNADLGRLRDVCAELEDAGIDAIQWDVMDGRFVPNLTFGPGVIAACRRAVSIPFEAHLMIAEPERSMLEYIDAGCECVIVHAEACRHLHRTLDALGAAPASAGVALNPATPLSALAHVVDLIDLLLLMTVNPGFGGQAYISTMEDKIRAARRLVDDQRGDIALEVDGGISSSTITGAAEAGADRFVVGSALFSGAGGPAGVVAALKGNLELEAAVSLR